MTRVRLKGVNRVDRRLADGTRRTYYYLGHGKGAVRLPGKPGSPEFMKAYNEAATAKIQAKPGTLLAVLNAFQSSAEFTGLAERTRQDYIAKIQLIEARFGDFPVKYLNHPRSRGRFLAWRDELATTSRRQADYTFVVFARILAWAHGRRITNGHPLERIGRLHRGSRSDSIWTGPDIERLLAFAGPEMTLAFMLGLHTGQRQGDLLRLPWSAYDGSEIRLKQSKTGVRVVVPIGDELRALLDDAPRISPVILVNSKGRPWTPNGFKASWRKLLAKAGIAGLTFNDLRGTYVTRLALQGSTAAQISRATGHSLSQASTILDRHYVSRKAVLENVRSPDFSKRASKRPKS